MKKSKENALHWYRNVDNRTHGSKGCFIKRRRNMNKLELIQEHDNGFCEFWYKGFLILFNYDNSGRYEVPAFLWSEKFKAPEEVIEAIHYHQ